MRILSLMSYALMCFVIAFIGVVGLKEVHIVFRLLYYSVAIGTSVFVYVYLYEFIDKTIRKIKMKKRLKKPF